MRRIGCHLLPISGLAMVNANNELAMSRTNVRGIASLRVLLFKILRRGGILMVISVTTGKRGNSHLPGVLVNAYHVAFASIK